MTMVRVLRNLKITEVSAVDRGAGDGCRVVLFKRDTPDNGNDDDEDYAAALAFLMHTPHGSALVRRFFPQGADTDDIERLARLVAHVMRARASNGDDEPSDPFQPWADIIGNNTEKKVSHMSDRNEALQAMVKRDGGVVALAKRICREGARGISESELTSLVTEHAQQLYPDMSPEGAFSKLFTSPGAEPLRRAVSVCKGLLDIEPVKVGGDDARDVDDATKAYEQLQQMAEAQRKRSPFLSKPQAFERAGRERPDLLNRATGSHQLPRR
jgi:hypothetical protein